MEKFLEILDQGVLILGVFLVAAIFIGGPASYIWGRLNRNRKSGEKDG